MFDYITRYSNFILNHESIWVQLLVAVFIVFLALLIRGLFARIILKLVLKRTQKTKTVIDRAIITAFESPLKSLILVVGIYLALCYLPLTPGLQIFVSNLFRSTIIIFIVWGLYNMVGGEAYKQIRDQLNMDRIISDFITKLIRFVIVALAIAIVAQEWDYDVNGFLAGLGLGGLAFALAAKDSIANMFGGMVIILDKPFDVGDWILTSNVEGTVEEVSFRSTKVRTFANALVTVPNSTIANQAITNWTRMQKRRISFHLGVTYSTPREKLQRCVQRIQGMLEKHQAVHPDTIFVRFEHFSDSSLDIFIYFFTRTIVWGEFLDVREDINFKIMEILEDEGVSIAFPSRSLYFENSLKSGSEKPALE